MSERRPPDDLFESLLDYEHDDPDARPLTDLTKEERDAALVAHGVDPDAVRARGAAVAADVLSRLGAPPHAPAAHPQDASIAVGAAHGVVQSAWLWVPAALVVGAIGARLLFGGDKELPKPPPPPDAGRIETDASSRHARDLLVAARVACQQQAWAVCLRALDNAHEEDPRADQGTEARALRDAATHGVAGDAGDKKAPDDKKVRP